MVAGALGIVDAGSGIVISLSHAALFDHRVRQRNGRQQAPGVRVDGVLENLLGGAGLQQMPQMQHTDAVGDVLDHGQVVGDEQIGRAGLLLDILHQVDYLCLNGHIQRRDALVRDDELGVHDEGAGNAHALTLTAGELVGGSARRAPGQGRPWQGSFPPFRGALPAFCTDGGYPDPRR